MQIYYFWQKIQNLPKIIKGFYNIITLFTSFAPNLITRFLASPSRGHCFVLRTLPSHIGVPAGYGACSPRQTSATILQHRTSALSAGIPEQVRSLRRHQKTKRWCFRMTTAKRPSPPPRRPSKDTLITGSIGLRSPTAPTVSKSPTAQKSSNATALQIKIAKFTLSAGVWQGEKQYCAKQ